MINTVDYTINVDDCTINDANQIFDLSLNEKGLSQTDFSLEQYRKKSLGQTEKAEEQLCYAVVGCEEALHGSDGGGGEPCAQKMGVCQNGA